MLLDFSFEQPLMAEQNHVVALEELQAQLVMQVAQRTQYIKEVQRLLDHHLVQRQLGRVVNLELITAALPPLDDKTLSQLADESRQMNDQSRGGRGEEWIIILVALLTVFILMADTNSGESS